MDEEQFEFIKRVIGDCDYYILIIGGRYGSTTQEGVSYTEKEYEYALNRGIKVLAFLHENPGKIPFDKSEQEPKLRSLLNTFRDKVSTGRLVKFWTKAEELPGLVALSLTKTIQQYPAPGWVRSTQIDSLVELEKLSNRNVELESNLFKMNSEVNKLQQELMDVRNERKSIIESNNDAIDKLDGLRKRNDELENNLSTSNFEINKLRQELADVQADRQSVIDRLGDTIAKLKELSERNEELEKLVVDMCKTSDVSGLDKLDEVIEIPVKIKLESSHNIFNTYSTQKVSISFSEIFMAIAPKLFSPQPPPDGQVKQWLEACVKRKLGDKGVTDVVILSEDIHTLKQRIVELGVICDGLNVWVMTKGARIKFALKQLNEAKLNYQQVVSQCQETP